MKKRWMVLCVAALFFLAACGEEAWEAPLARHGEKAMLDVVDATDGEAVFVHVDWICMRHDDGEIDDEMCVFYVTYERDEATHYILVITSEPDGGVGLVAQRANVPDEATLATLRTEMLEDIEHADTPIQHEVGTLDIETIDVWIEARE